VGAIGRNVESSGSNAKFYFPPDIKKLLFNPRQQPGDDQVANAPFQPFAVFQLSLASVFTLSLSLSRPLLWLLASYIGFLNA
jgi:hypothetical protein